MGRLLLKRKVIDNRFTYLLDFTKFTPPKRYIYLECSESENYLLFKYRKTTFSMDEYMIIKKDNNAIVKQDIFDKNLANKIIKLLEI